MAADVADAFCGGEIRLTVDQKLLFPNVDTEKVEEMIKMPLFEKFPVVSFSFSFFLLLLLLLLLYCYVAIIAILLYCYCCYIAIAIAVRRCCCLPS